MKVKFIKDHVSGIGKGSILKIEDPAHVARLIKGKYAEEADEKTAYKMIPTHIEDPGKEAREKKQKKADEARAKALLVRAQKHKQP